VSIVPMFGAVVVWKDKEKVMVCNANVSTVWSCDSDALGVVGECGKAKHLWSDIYVPSENRGR